MAAKVWATEEIVTATDLNIVAAQADDAMKPSGNLAGLLDVAAARAALGLAGTAVLAVGTTADTVAAGNDSRITGAAQKTADLGDLASAATARTNLGLSPVAATGDYGDLSDTPTQNSDAAGAGLLFVDGGYTALGEWNGTALTLETAMVAPRVDVSAGEVFLGSDGLSFTDAGYTSIGTIGPDGVQFDVAATVQDFTATGVATLGALTIEETDTGTGFVVVDGGYTVMALFEGDETAAAESVQVHSAEEIASRDGANRAASAAMAVAASLNVARPVWGYSHFLIYGQSLSIGSESTPILTASAKYNNLMYGDQVRPTTNNSATATWDRVGASAFNGLVSTGGTEVPIVGAINTYRRLYLSHRGIAADATIRFVASSAGIGGQDIASLSLGASPDIYQRLISCMSQAHTQATSDSGSYGVAAMLWMQGESDQTRTSAYYLPLLRSVYSDFKAAVNTETSQADPPAFFLYQTTAPNTNFDNANLGVQMAQLTMGLDDDGVYMVGPNYPYPDSNNLHLPANTSRWMGSMFGKVMHQVLNRGLRWKPLHIRRATRKGLQILLDYHVPVPPLLFEEPWLQDGWFVGETALAQTNTQYNVADEGFTVRSTTASAFLSVASVALASDTSIIITLAAMPPASHTLIVRYADGRHFGHGTVRDSDPTLADEVWEHVTSRTDADTNATLLGARYPLPNWAVAQQITVEAI